MAHQSLDWSNWEAVRARKAAAAEPTVEMDERERLAVMLHPKDGELCLDRTKSGETLVEVRCGVDVQIARQSWV
ncbi:hypothetical protein DIPPA_31663 [Diplonema papillatum]|nr:hypothetical protein DIPPA_31663 [Diplonema papillatum]